MAYGPSDWRAGRRDIYNQYLNVMRGSPELDSYGNRKHTEYRPADTRPEFTRIPREFTEHYKTRAEPKIEYHNENGSAEKKEQKKEEVEQA